MADQEFLVSYGVQIDETGVARLKEILEQDRALADLAAAAFSSADAAVRAFQDLAFSGWETGIGKAGTEWAALVREMGEPVRLELNTAPAESAARSALETIRGLFSAPLWLDVRSRLQAEAPGREEPGAASVLLRMSSGGRFTKPTEVQVAEDGDSEYIIPVKKEDRAVPLIRQMLGELSPAAREDLLGDPGGIAVPLSGVSAGTAGTGTVTQNNKTVSAPVNIYVQASGADPEEIGESVYEAAERYLVRTLKGVS